MSDRAICLKVFLQFGWCKTGDCEGARGEANTNESNAAGWMV